MNLLSETIAANQPTPTVVRELLLQMDARHPDLFFEGPDELLGARRPNGLETLSQEMFQSMVDAYLTATAGKKQYPVPSRFVSSAMRPGPHGVLRRLHRIVSLPHIARSPGGKAGWRFESGYNADELSWHDYPIPAAKGTRDDYLWLLDLVLGGFTFATSLDRWIAEAAILTPLFRPRAPWVPAFLPWAKVPSAGKTLLAQLIGRVHLGAAPRVDPIGVKGWELDYAIGSALQYAGPAGLVILDNLIAGEAFSNAVLASILTARAKVRTPRLPKLATGVWVDPAHLLLFATGIDPSLGPELRRRFLPIHLQQNQTGSWPRSPDQIEQELDQNRSRVVAALVWAVSKGLRGDAHRHSVELPSYIEWGQIAGGLLMAIHAEEAEEIEGAWASLPDLLLRYRPTEQDIALLSLLAAVPQDSPGSWPFLRPSQLLRRLNEDAACSPLLEPLSPLLGGSSPRAVETRLGMRLGLLVREKALHNQIGVEDRPHRAGGKEYRAIITGTGRR